MSSKPDIIKLEMLFHLGLSENTIRTFGAILELSTGATVIQLQKVLNIPRPTIYNHLEELEKAELVVRGLKEQGSIFYPAQPEVVEAIFLERSKQLKRGAETVKNLYLRKGKQEYSPRFTVLDKGRAAKKVFWDILRTRPEKACFFWPGEHMRDKVTDELFTEWYIERFKRKIQTQILWPQSQQLDFTDAIEKVPEKDLREVRVLPKGLDASMTYVVYGNKVAYISSEQEDYGFIVDSKEHAGLMQSQFDYLWKISKQYLK